MAATRADEPRPSLPAFEQYVKGLLAETPAAQVGFLEKALSLAPGFDRARLELSRAHAVTGEWLKAREAALAVPAGSRYAARAQLEGAVAEIGLSRYDEAFTRLKALGDQTGAPEVFNNLGVIQLRRGATAQSGRPTFFFNQAVEADPAQADYAFNLGYAYWREQDHLAAVYWLREAVRREPSDSDAHFVLAAALQATRCGHRGGPGARARAAPVGAPTRNRHARRSPTWSRPISSGCARISIHPALDVRTRR